MTTIAVGAAAGAGPGRPHWVNGRLLFAEDLEADHDADRRRDHRLGRAVGAGVVTGLEVTGAPGGTRLTVAAGAGTAPDGTECHLDAPTVLDLSSVTLAPARDDSVFGDCRPADATTRAPGAGAYVLTVRATRGLAGRVPVAAPVTARTPVPCANRWETDGVVFEVIRLDGFAPDPATATPQNRRTHLAHWCFGSASLEDLALSGFTAPLPHRGLDTVADLTGAHLPLAVLDWDGAALAFVDVWSARRRPVRPSAALTGAGDAIVGDGRAADGEARFQQFQSHLAELLATPAGHAVRAVDVFPLLPPAAVLPIDTAVAAAALQTIATGGSVGAGGQEIAALLAPLLAAHGGTGVSPDTFFGGLSGWPRIGMVEVETVDHVLRRSWLDEPLVLTAPGPRFEVFFVVSADHSRVAGYVLLVKAPPARRWLRDGRR